MKKYFCWFIIIFLLSKTVDAQLIVAQRTQGIAPLGVHFSLSDTTWTSLKDYDYEWIFPDNDTVIGFQALHTFLSSGMVYLNITLPDGTITHDSINIQVLSADDAYSGTNTICYSNTSNFSGCPIGAQNITLSDLASVTFATGKRLLFRENEIFTLSGSKTLYSNCFISSFGTTGDKAIVQISGDATSTTFWMQDSIIVDNITFQGAEWVQSLAWGGQMYGEGRLFAPENQTTLHNLEIRNMTAFAIMDDGIGAKRNLVMDKVHAENLGSYFFYAGPSPSVEFSGAKSCTIQNVMSNHGIRLNGGKYFMAHQLHIDSVDRSHITYRGLRYGIVSDSKFTGKGFYKNSIRNISNDASVLDTVRFIIFERNQYASRDNEFALDFNIGSDIVVRNNLLLNSSFNIGENLSNVIPQRIEIFSNTFYQSNFDWYASIILRSGSTGIFKGNIAYSDNCVSSNCINENPFASYSNQTSTTWQMNENAYWVNGDLLGNNFKNGISFSNWQSLGWEAQSVYGDMQFVNKTSDLNMANFMPSTGIMKNLTTHLVHRDLFRNRRMFNQQNDAGAIESFSSTGTEVIFEQQKILHLFPNPAKNTISYNNNNIIANSFVIYDVLGNVVASNTLRTTEINISDLAVGQYILLLKDERGNYYKGIFIKI